MAQSIQIVPKFSFPYAEIVVNDYTLVTDDRASNPIDTTIKQAYAVVAGKGIDNVWVRKSNKASAVKTFGNSNFKKFGQPLMQALNVLEQNNSSVWFMRVMPENATYSNNVVSIGYKADKETDVADAHKRKFRVKLVAESVDGVTTKKELKESASKIPLDTVDSEGFNLQRLLYANYSGRGTCGNDYSMRMSQNIAYEKEYGIKMYNFEIITTESGLTKDANYVGALYTSSKYGSESTTLIDDVLGDTEVGVTPVDIVSNEEGIEVVYSAYVKFLKDLHKDCVAEYEEKLDDYDVPTDMLNGTVAVTEAYREKYDELKDISTMIDATDDSEIPDIDEFDPVFGLRVGSATEMLPAIKYVELLTDSVDVSADDYDASDYTEDENLVDFSSVKGLEFENGTNGYFDEPRTVLVDGVSKKYTYDDEVALCYINAYNGTYDPKILSARRIALTSFFDANYPFEVKKEIVKIAESRNDCRVWLDTGIINSIGKGDAVNLINTYSIFDDHMISIDIHNYDVKEYSTNKKCNVTITYLLSAEYVNHVTENGFHIPFVKANCQLTGHVKDSLRPVIEEYNVDIKELLYDNRLNYFECMSENVFQRATQNTTQKAETDLLEENNSAILFVLKRSIEADIQDQIYNFSDESIRKSFITTESAKYATWNGRIVESFDISFTTSQYEFEHSILHCYLAVVFRGLTKQCIVEIDINKRSYTSSLSETTEEE